MSSVISTLLTEYSTGCELRAEIENIVEDDSRFGLQRGEDWFEALSNFVLTVKLEVIAGPRSGFLAKVVFQGDLGLVSSRHHHASHKTSSCQCKLLNYI